MYKQTAAGKAPHEALLSGALTAGVEVAGAELSKLKNEVGKNAVKEVISKIKRLDKISVKKVFTIIKSDPDLAKDLLKGFGFEVKREGVIYLLDYLADRVSRDPEATFDVLEFARSAALDKVSGFVESKEKKLAEEIERFWNALG